MKQKSFINVRLVMHSSNKNIIKDIVDLKFVLSNINIRQILFLFLKKKTWGKTVGRTIKKNYKKM